MRHLMRSGILALTACLVGCIATRERVPDGNVFTGKDCDSNADHDCDGIVDNKDNCPDAANYEQGDLDEDGTGNACDECPAKDDKLCQQERFARQKAAQEEQATWKEKQQAEAKVKAVAECETAKKWLVDGRYASRVLSVLNNCQEAEIVAQAEKHWKGYEQKGYLILSSQLAQIAGFELEAARIRRKTLSGVQVSVVTTVEIRGRERDLVDPAKAAANEGHIAQQAQQLIIRWLQDFGATVVENAATVASGYLLHATLRVTSQSSFDSVQEVADQVALAARTYRGCPIQTAIFTAKGSQGEVYTSQLVNKEQDCREHWARLPELIQQLAFARAGVSPAPETQP